MATNVFDSPYLEEALSDAVEDFKKKLTSELCLPLLLEKPSYEDARKSANVSWEEVARQMHIPLVFVEMIEKNQKGFTYSRPFSKEPLQCMLHTENEFSFDLGDRYYKIPSFSLLDKTDYKLDSIIRRILHIQTTPTSSVSADLSKIALFVDDDKVDIVKRAKARLKSLDKSIDAVKKYYDHATRTTFAENIAKKHSEAEFLCALSYHVIKPMLAVTDRYVMDTSCSAGYSSIKRSCFLCEDQPCKDAPESDIFRNLLLGRNFTLHGIPDAVAGLDPHSSQIRHAQRKTPGGHGDELTFVVKSAGEELACNLDDSFIESSDDSAIDLPEGESYFEAKVDSACNDGLYISTEMRQLITAVVVSAMHCEQRKGQLSVIRQGILVNPKGFRFVWFIPSEDLLLTNSELISWEMKNSFFLLFLLLNRRYLLDTKYIIERLITYRQSKNSDLTFGYPIIRNTIFSRMSVAKSFATYMWSDARSSRKRESNDDVDFKCDVTKMTLLG